MNGIIIEREIVRVEHDDRHLFVRIPGAPTRTFLPPGTADDMLMALGRAMQAMEAKSPPGPTDVLFWLTTHGASEIGQARYAYVDVPYTDDDGIPADFPGREGSDDRGVIVFKLDLNTGKIIGWPEGRHEGLLLLVGHNAAVTVTDSDDDVLQDQHGRLPDWLPVTGGAFVVDIQGDGSITIDDGKTWTPDPDAIGTWLRDRTDEDAE